ncbi:methyltransferase family protein [Xenorhabdus kozodoii]|uniref:Isoprenylcysteine carboxyl methyltransferase n=1 Tax=Xenorhabdus kozodoii TaxID=351676 RepID=A0A2D0L5E2_9GAMM|nr:isoprenylcysteine carboxylmethyltransferase family protein [Xenorhabdus kozodoii]PHM70617.1 hypothetical protein Xkoz_03057 [Xenorhabdus kozodoii]
MLFSYVSLAIGLLWIVSETIIGSLKRTNNNTSNIVDGRSEIIIKIITYGALIIAFWLSKSKEFRFARQDEVLTWFGLFMIIAGLLLRWHLIYKLKKFFTVNVAILDDHQLITNGVYRYIRHPAYLSVIIAFFGMGLSLGNLLSILASVIPVTLAFLWRIRIEEKALLLSFPDHYPDYKKKSWRLIPFII